MHPIYERSPGKGIGYEARAFSNRFEELCKEHLAQKRAKAFAFIFYDFHNEDFRKVLMDQGVFTKLDRLSGTDLSLFYIHSDRRAAVAKFNSNFLSRLGFDSKIPLPCVVFFRLEDDKITDIAATALESADLIHGFHELHTVIENYRSRAANDQPKQLKILRWFKSASKFITLEAFRALLKAALAGLFEPSA